jgi:hypothetical protein
VTAGRLAGLVLGRLDRLVLAWRQLAAVAFDSESGCLLLDFVDVQLGAKLQVQVGRRGRPHEVPALCGARVPLRARPRALCALLSAACRPLPPRRCSCSTCCPP